MRFLCFGMGAIGTYIGGSLAAAGHELVFIERTAGIEHPLRLEFKDQLIDLPAVTTINSVEKAMTGSPFDCRHPGSQIFRYGCRAGGN